MTEIDVQILNLFREYDTKLADMKAEIKQLKKEVKKLKKKQKEHTTDIFSHSSFSNKSLENGLVDQYEPSEEILTEEYASEEYYDDEAGFEISEEPLDLSNEEGFEISAEPLELSEEDANMEHLDEEYWQNNEKNSTDEIEPELELEPYEADNDDIEFVYGPPEDNWNAEENTVSLDYGVEEIQSDESNEE
jgi:hypothetical protein